MAGDRATDRLVGLLGCWHHPDEPHRPYCEVTLAETETYRPQPQLEPLVPLVPLEPLEPLEREPAGGNPYWADTEDTRR